MFSQAQNRAQQLSTGDRIQMSSARPAPQASGMPDRWAMRLAARTRHRGTAGIHAVLAPTPAWEPGAVEHSATRMSLTIGGPAAVERSGNTEQKRRRKTSATACAARAYLHADRRVNPV
jgi:hypothetical protein